MVYLLDTSAFLSFFFGEPGSGRVEEILEDPGASVALSVLTHSEFWARLKAEGEEEVFGREWGAHLPLFEQVHPVDRAVSARAVYLRGAAMARLPLIDSLIAGTAALHGAVLVHADPHFEAIPSGDLRQERIPGR